MSAEGEDGGHTIAETMQEEGGGDGVGEEGGGGGVGEEGERQDPAEGVLQLFSGIQWTFEAEQETREVSSLIHRPLPQNGLGTRLGGEGGCGLLMTVLTQ